MSHNSRTLPLLLLLAIAFTPATPSTPMTVEDVVRLHVGGMSVDELIRRIDSSEVAFDLSDEMVDELRIAGIPERLLDAMRARQAAMNPVTEKPAGDAADTDASRLVVLLNPEWEPKKDTPLPVLRALDAVDPQLVEALRLRSDDLTVTDLGIALLCRTSDHVPDQWRAQTPLGRDFNVPRHRALVFVSGATAEPVSKFRNMLSKLGKVPGEWESTPEMKMLSLEVPERLSIELEPGVAHDLTLGITMRVGERNYLMLSDAIDGIILEQGTETTIRAELKPGGQNPLKARVAFLEDEDG